MFFSFRKRSRRRLLAEPFPESWQLILRDNVFLYQLLTEAEQARLRQAVRIVVAEKNWEGCDGLTITDEIRVTIAAQACLLLLGFDDYYFDELKTILVYPGSFLAEDPASQQSQQRLGEAHHGGPVVLSWWDARWSGRRRSDSNLVLHEFAHKLAELGDFEAGRPPMPNAEQQRRWDAVMKVEYQRLADDAAYDRPSLLHPYGASDRAEFFAVATECFFLQPAALRRRHSQLYQILAEWYRQDPARRREPSPEEEDRAAEAEREYARHALAECDAAIQLRPDQPDAYWHRAAWYYELEDYERALADYSTVIRLTAEDPDPEAYCDRGVVYRALKQYEDALTDFDAALRCCPRYARAWWERGRTHACRGDLKQALADLDRAVRVDPRDDTAWLERGLVLRDLGQDDKALRDFSRAIRLSPYSADAYWHRAAIQIRRRRFAEALADCNQALELEPGLAEAYQTRAVAWQALGRTEEARQDQARAVKLQASR